jgi:hypothetical protein
MMKRRASGGKKTSRIHRSRPDIPEDEAEIRSGEPLVGEDVDFLYLYVSDHFLVR